MRVLSLFTFVQRGVRVFETPQTPHPTQCPLFDEGDTFYRVGRRPEVGIGVFGSSSVFRHTSESTSFARRMKKGEQCFTPLQNGFYLLCRNLCQFISKLFVNSSGSFSSFSHCQNNCCSTKHDITTGINFIYRSFLDIVNNDVTPFIYI